MKMKKVVLLALALILALSLAACDGNSGNSGGNTAPSGNTRSGDTNTTSPSSRDGDIDEAISRLNEYLKSLGLEEDEYGFTQYGVWNSDLLPDCVPAAPSGVIDVDRTEYKDKKHEDMMAGLGAGYGVGNLSFPDKNYEEHMVMFTCTPAALAEFLDGIDANGFKGGLYEVDPNNKSRYEWVGNGYYAHMISYEDWDDKNIISVELVLTPTLNPFPKSFQGTPLPDFGLIMSYEEFGGYGWENDDSVDNFWDKYNDKGDLPEYWNIWYEYDFVTMDEAKAYVQKMTSNGWEIAYESEEEGWSGEIEYNAQLKKGDIRAAVGAPYDGRNNMAVRFGTDFESLYY
jgi:hypothetical protein